MLHFCTAAVLHFSEPQRCELVERECGPPVTGFHYHLLVGETWIYLESPPPDMYSTYGRQLRKFLIT